ncbi:MAG: putative transcriptional regulator [Bradyrhizobium sp.]|jgi:putative transcriptional regulator|nr:putative transcriptional regulator [Bradyrhizobium sp.]
MTKTTKTSRLVKEMLETADDMLKVGLMDAATHEKITMRHLGRARARKVVQITPKQIRSMREQANISQAVFAHYLNISVDYLSKLERGEKHPTGAALALLNVVKRKGLEVIL